MASVDKSDCVGVLIEEAVAQFLTSLDLLGMDDKTFITLHSKLERICKKPSETEINKVVVETLELEKLTKELIKKVEKIHERFKVTDVQMCAKCGEYKLLEAFRRYKNGTLNRTCRECDNRLKLKYQQERSEWR